jgi:biotin synthase-related radical SAM superfamily protein
MSRFCLVLLGAPSLEEKLLDVLLDAVGDEVFTSIPTFSHGTSHGRLSSVEQVMGRSAAVQVQILVTEKEMTDLVQRLREEFRGTGLRYWASALAAEGEIQ